ncbi:MAG: hypothetical protein ACXWL2_05325, partial [Candidatus Chromulinivorax sp.]
KHFQEVNISSANKNILQSSYPKILDQKIYDDNGENVALTKNAFADNILKNIEPFDSVSFAYFEDLLKILQEITNDRLTPVI